MVYPCMIHWLMDPESKKFGKGKTFKVVVLLCIAYGCLQTCDLTKIGASFRVYAFSLVISVTNKSGWFNWSSAWLYFCSAIELVHSSRDKYYFVKLIILLSRLYMLIFYCGFAFSYSRVKTWVCVFINEDPFRWNCNASFVVSKKMSCSHLAQKRKRKRCHVLVV